MPLGEVNMEKQLEVLRVLVAYLSQAHIAIPMIVGTVSAVAAILRGMTGQGPSLNELANLIEEQVATNEARGRAEIERLLGA